MSTAMSEEAQELPGGPKVRIHFEPTEDEARRIRNMLFYDEVCRGQLAGALGRVRVETLNVERPTHSERREYRKVVERGEDYATGGAVSDAPILAQGVARLTGSKSRNNFNNLIRKGLFHSYGKGKGVVPIEIYEKPPDGVIEWYSLSDMERQVLMCFDRLTWCCRTKEFESRFRQAESWRLAPMLDQAPGLTGQQIALALDTDLDANQHLRRDVLPGLVDKSLLTRLPTPGRGRTQVVYMGNPANWPFRSASVGHCPAIDGVNRWRRQYGLDPLSHDLTAARRRQS